MDKIFRPLPNLSLRNSQLAVILLDPEQVDKPPVSSSILLDLPPLLHPPATLVSQLEHVLVDVAVLLHDLRVLLGHHVDHDPTGLAQASHCREACKRNVSGCEASHHYDTVIGAAKQLAGYLCSKRALDHLVVHGPLLEDLLLGAVQHLSAEVETSHRSEASLGESGANCSSATGNVQHFQL